MHQCGASDHLPAEGGTDRLMPEADSQKRYLAGKMPDCSDRYTRLLRRAGTGRDNYPGRPQLLDLIKSYPVVPVKLHLLAQFTEVLDDVVGKGVVIIYHQ